MNRNRKMAMFQRRLCGCIVHVHRTRKQRNFAVHEWFDDFDNIVVFYYLKRCYFWN